MTLPQMKSIEDALIYITERNMAPLTHCHICQWPYTVSGVHQMETPVGYGIPPGKPMCILCFQMFYALAVRPYWANLVLRRNT